MKPNNRRRLAKLKMALKKGSPVANRYKAAYARQQQNEKLMRNRLSPDYDPNHPLVREILKLGFSNQPPPTP